MNNTYSLFRSAVLALSGLALATHVMCAQPAPAKTAATATKKESPVELEADRKPKVNTNGNCLIRGGTVITVAGPTLQNADVLVQNGKITAVGKNLSAAPGVTVIDAAGKFVSPGIIDAHSHIASDATNEGTDSITAEVRIQDVLDPQSISIFRGLSSGVTTSLVLHGSANPIGGQSTVIKMKWMRPVEELLIPDAPRMIKFALGENVKRSYRSPGESGRYPSTRMGVETVYRRAFADARDYRKRWDDYEKEKTSSPNAVPPRRDLRLETLADVLRGKVWVQCHCYRADEMLMIVRLSQEFGFKIGALQHALEAYKIAPELARAHIPVSTFADAWAYKVEAYDAIPYNAAFCLRSGIVTSVNSDNGAGTYRLNLEAAKAIKFGGLTEEEAWKLITINPAIQLGIDKRTGTLEPGKDADIAIWTGHPFTTSSKCDMTLVEGNVYFQRRDAFEVDKISFVSNSLAACKADHLALPVPPANAHLYAIVGATLHPVSGPDILNGTIVMEEGHIAAIGAKITIPRGAYVVQGKGLHIYPGMIDAGSVLGLEEIDQVNATLDRSETGAFQPDLITQTAIHADSDMIAVTRCDGVTTALSRPTAGGGGFRGGGSLIAGQGSVIDLAGWTNEEMGLKKTASLHVAFPEGARGYTGRRALPAEMLQRLKDQEMEQVAKLREYFEKAKRYQAARTQSSVSVPFDPIMEAMRPYVTGTLPVVFSVNSAMGIKQAVQFADSLGLKAIVETGADSLRVADLLAQKHIPVIYKLPMQNSLDTATPPHEYDPYDSLWAAPGILQRAGVKVCFASNSAPQSKSLPTQVGITRGYGLSPEAALKSLTLHAAEILGVSDTVGSLQAGKLANVIVTDGDPLEISTHLHYLFIAGKPVPLDNHHTYLYEKFQQRLYPGTISSQTISRTGNAASKAH